jgi:FdhE protein
MSVLDLREAWADLLRRRPAFAGTLAIYGALVEHWTGTSVRVRSLGWSAEDCRSRWMRGVPLLADAALPLDAAAVEESVSRVMELIADARPDTVEGLRRFADAWDRGAITPASLFPARGRIGAFDDAVGLCADVVAFIALATLRPRFEPYFARCRDHLADGDWALGICPFCGAPPGYADVLEDGRRKLACHFCGGGWTFTRLRCPFCGNDETKELSRLEPEAADQGYFISVCKACRAYLKELDRRVRWNGGPALVEDWGSPHFDLAADRAGYWRPGAPVLLARGPSPR